MLLQTIATFSTNKNSWKETTSLVLHHMTLKKEFPKNDWFIWIKSSADSFSTQFFHFPSFRVCFEIEESIRSRSKSSSLLPNWAGCKNSAILLVILEIVMKWATIIMYWTGWRIWISMVFFCSAPPVLWVLLLLLPGRVSDCFSTPQVLC